MHRGYYIVRRLVHVIPVLFGITLVVFTLLHLIPGDPAPRSLACGQTPTRSLPSEHELGLDQPLWYQYVKYLQGLASFDLGDSLKFKVRVASLLVDRLKVSLALIAYAVLLIVCRCPAGKCLVCLSAKDSVFDHVTRMVL